MRQLRRWDFNEPAAEDDESESESSDEEFVLETGAESSGKEPDEQGEPVDEEAE
jgi:hypothetical protein